MAKELNIHQLAIGLTSVLDKQEQSQKKILLEMQATEKKLSEHMAELRSLKILVNTDHLEEYNQKLIATTQVASERIQKALKAFIISPYVVGFCILLVLSNVFSIWFSFSKVQELQTEKDSMQKYYNFTTDYFNANPKEWEKVKKWQPPAKK